MIVCANPIIHRPDPKGHLNRHHIVPLSWGGQTVESNLIWLCPTCHELVHSVLNLFVRVGGKPAAADLQPYPMFFRVLAFRTIEMNGGVVPHTYTLAHPGGH
jgi:hypothetical protein